MLCDDFTGFIKRSSLRPFFRSSRSKFVRIIKEPCRLIFATIEHEG